MGVVTGCDQQDGGHVESYPVYVEEAGSSGGALDQMSDAAAHSVLTFAMTTSAVNGTDKGSDNAVKSSDLTFLGSHAQR